MFRLYGGLGNQLFQLGEAFRIYTFFGTQVELNLSLIENRERIKKLIWQAGLDEVFSCSNETLPSCKTNSLIAVSEFWKHSAYLLTSSGKSKHFEVHGWIPDVRRVEENGLFVRGTFLFDSLPLEKRDGSTAAIHIRRGDYAINPNLGLTSVAYFRKAVTLAKDMGITNFRVFSDEIKVATGIVDVLRSRTLLNFELMNIDDALSTLRELSSYSSLIASNSTFSFWAHYFSNAYTYYPYPFYTSQAGFGKKLFRSVDGTARSVMDWKRVPSATNWKLHKVMGRVRKKG